MKPGRPRGVVLVVDDEAAIRTIVHECLRDEDFRVASAGTYLQAADALAHVRFDLVLADTLGAPVAHGGAFRWDQLEHLRALAGPTPMVIFTAHRRDAFTGFEARGFRDILLKPFVLDDLVAVVERHIMASGS